MAWWRSPSLPASSLLIGNLSIDSKDFILNLKSLIGTFPIVLGDPRKIAHEKRKEIKKWSDWMQKMQAKYDYMSFRQDAPGFGEPQDGSWDAWLRINTETKNGGIAGVFRHGALENHRKLITIGLDQNAKYRVTSAPDGKLVCLKTGKELMTDGILVSFQNLYDGEIYEIEKID